MRTHDHSSSMLFCSTDTAVFNDIPLASDAGDYVVLLLLDLTATFDTVD